MEWKFSDPPNIVVLTTHGIVETGNWIAHVSHDEDDGVWQFHDSTLGPIKEDDALVIGLREIVSHDASVAALADMPRGWHALRASRNSPWQRSKT